MATVYALTPALSKVEQRERVRRIGLAGQALAQLRLDYQRHPNSLILAAIKRTVRDLASLAKSLDEETT